MRKSSVFKALLFLAFGWVIYVYRHSQSSAKMDGKGILSLEFIFLLIGSGSLVALHLFSSWYSKEAIILSCTNKNICIMLVFTVWMAAILTSLYSTEIFYRIFVKGAEEAGLEGESIEKERMSTEDKMQMLFKGYKWAVSRRTSLIDPWYITCITFNC